MKGFAFVIGVLLLFILAVLVGCTTAPKKVEPAPVTPDNGTVLNVTLELSKPANGSFFKKGEKATVTVTLKDKNGNPLTKDDFVTLNLYMYGPQEPPKTKTAVKLLNASTDRSKTPHHYVDLLKDTNVKVNGNVLKYTLQPVGDEEAGTYITSVWAVSKATGLRQAFPWVETQIGTATVEKQLVDGTKCQACHKGADSGKFYMNHIDPLKQNDPNRSPTGNWALDSDPVRTCKSCHNNDGYAAFVDPTSLDTRVADNIVYRVHGIHMGEELKSTYNIGDREADIPGVFENYTGVIFPNNVKNCASCHVDDRFKTKPSRMACGACHDSIWFGELASMPKGNVAHDGGPQANDSICATCHPADTGGIKAVAEAHKVEQLINTIDVSLTPPRNGKYFVAGERPVVTLVIKNDKGNPIDHTTVGETTFSPANLYVYGPRQNSVPVLTNAAKNGNSKSRASVTSSIPASQQSATDTTKGWTFAAGDTFKIAVHGGPVQELAAPTGLQTPTQVVDWLKANLKDVTVTANSAGNINIQSQIPGATSKFEIYNSAVTTKMGWKPAGLDIIEHGQVVGKTVGTTMEPFVVIGAASTAGNDLRLRSDPLNYTDPAVTRNLYNITYQLDDVASLKPGTYMIYTYVLPVAGKVPGFTLKEALGFMTFQVGTETPDKKVATNCTNCHGSNIWHLDAGAIHSAPFDPDYCKACHDYNRSGTGEGYSRTGGTSTSGWAGYGTKLLSARLHGVHRGAYLDHPENIYAGNPNAFAEVIFPQDIRNCTKCHSADTTGTWKTEPSRQACMSCHDSDSAKAHGTLMTSDPTPADPYGPDGVETCKTCHGAGKEFSPDKVHNIANPYKPPYPREPE